jgi:hypothetical protein
MRLGRIRTSALRLLLLGDRAEWGADEENRARLLEVEAYRLDLQWIDRTTDHDDPTVRREMLQAKRDGVRPPTRPIIPPAALRPNDLADERMQDWINQLAATAPKPAKELVTLDEFDRVVSQM